MMRGEHEHGPLHAQFAAGGDVDHSANGFDPTEILRDFDYGKTRRLPGGRTLREWEIVAVDKEIEVAPGVKYAGLDLQRPRARADAPLHRGRTAADPLHERLQPSAHDALPRRPLGAAWTGCPGSARSRAAGRSSPARASTTSSTPSRSACTSTTATSTPLPTHIAKGLYGAFIIDPKEGRPPADEMVMVMNAFDTNFDKRQRGLRGQHRRLPLPAPPDPGQARRAGADLPRQRGRVRPAQLLPRPRATSSTTTRPARRSSPPS